MSEFDFIFVLWVIGSCVAFNLALKSYSRYKGLKHAEFVVQHQFDKANPELIKQGFAYFKGDQLERYKVVVDRVNEAVGSDGLLVGHVQWIMFVVEDEKVDIQNVKIPSFTR